MSKRMKITAHSTFHSAEWNDVYSSNENIVIIVEPNFDY